MVIFHLPLFALIEPPLLIVIPPLERLLCPESSFPIYVLLHRTIRVISVHYLALKRQTIIFRKTEKVTRRKDGDKLNPTCFLNSLAHLFKKTATQNFALISDIFLPFSCIYV